MVVVLQRTRGLTRAGALGLVAVVACGRAPEAPRVAQPAQVAGTLVAVGLEAAVRVVRDRWGVAHIRAENQNDLFFAQGFIQAQDRLFQMDLWRRSVQGRLSEVLGPNFIERDAMTRRVQYRGDLDQEWASYGPHARAIATAFTRGINAWIRVASDPPPEEFRLAGWAPELWRPEDLLNRTDAFLASADAQAEVFRAGLTAALGAGRASALLQLQGEPLVVPPGLDLAAISPVVGDILRRVGTPPFFMGLAAPMNVRLGADITESQVGSVRHQPDLAGSVRLQPDHFGSNAWAVARGDRGAPLLASDPHTPLANPSLRYLVHLEAPGWRVIGATSPWLPGVAIGHNDRVAWSMTASSADTQDLYVERLNPNNPRQVLDRGRFVDMAVETDAIAVKGRAEPFEYERFYTTHGVVVALDRERQLAFTLRWSGTEPGAAAELGALAIGRAGSAAEFRRALAAWRMPAAEFVYADVDGHVGRQAAALAPVRSGWNGALPVPAEDGRYEWGGWLTLDALPHEDDPGTGLVVSANDSQARWSRIADVLAAPGARSLDGFKTLQHDVVSWNAGRLVPLLERVKGDREDVERARLRLLRWDRRVTVDSQEAALYARWEARLRQELAALRVPAALVDEHVEHGRAVLVPSLVGPSRAWFEGNVARARDRLLVSALGAVVNMTTDNRDRVVTFAHPLGVSDPSRRRFNVGGFALPGYDETVLSVRVAGSNRVIGPSLRVVMEAGDWDRSVATNAPGQSGSAGSRHFSDLAEPWVGGEYFPLAFGDEAIRSNTESVLILRPR